jgi:hypothetical protein
MKTHQPYLFRKNNERFLLFTKGDATKTYESFDGVTLTFESIYVKNLDTQQEKKLFDFEEHIECNPVYFEEQGKKYISYIKSNNLSESPVTIFDLYKVEVDDNFDTIGEHILLKENTYSGFENEQYVVFSELEHYQIFLIFMNKKTQERKKFKITQLVDQQPLFRVVPVYGQLNSVLLTSATSEMTAYIADINNFYNFKVVLNKDKKPVYKCSVLDDLLVYAVKIGLNREDRELVFEEAFALR